MKDLARMKSDLLTRREETSTAQLKECHRDIDDMKEILPAARSARERTTLNIVLDDQKKVAKALERLVGDLAGAVGGG